MLRRPIVLGTFGRLVVLVAVAVIATTGLCLLDSDEVGGVDLCAFALAVTPTLPLAFPLPMTGRTLPALAGLRSLYTPDLRAPPPKA